MTLDILKISFNQTLQPGCLSSAVDILGYGLVFPWYAPALWVGWGLPGLSARIKNANLVPFL